MVVDIWLNLEVLHCACFVLESFFQLLDALFVLLISVVSQAEQVEHIWVLLVLVEGLVQVGSGLVIILCFVVGLAAVLEELNVLGVQLDGLVEVGQGFLVVFLFVVATAQAIKNAGDAWVFTLSLLKVPDRRINLLIPQLARPIMEVSLNTVLINLNRPFKILNSFLIISLILIHKTPLNIHSLVIRQLFHNFSKHVSRLIKATRSSEH